MSYKIVAKQPSILWSDINEINDRIDAKYYHCDYMVFNIKNYGEFEIKSLKQCVNFFETGVSNFNDGNIKLKRLKTSNIQNGFILYQDLTDCVVPERDKKKILCKGDVVLTTYGTGSIGKVAYVNFDTQIIPDYTIAILRTKKTIDSGYLASFLGSIYGKQQIMRRVIGTSGITLVIKPHLIDIQIPIPSPEIQKYIGDKVRKAEELREEAKRLKIEAEEIFFNEINIVSIDNAFKKEQHIKFNWINIDELDVNRIDAEYNRRKYTILVKLLIDNNITLIPISNLLEEPIVSGSTPKGGNYIENGIPFVRATNLCEYSIDDNLVYISKEESDKLKNSEIRSGDVVFSIAGSIGVASIIPSYIEKANINQALVRLRLNNINKYYFVFVVNSSIGRLLSLRLANGAVQLNLNREEVGNIMVPRINDNKEEIIANKIKLYIELLYQSKQLIQEAKQDVEDLIEGNFDMSKVKANS